MFSTEIILNWYKFEERSADVFQIYPNAIHLNHLQFYPSMHLLGFPVFCLSSSIVLNGYFHILVNSMTIWSVMKLPKIARPSPFKQQTLRETVVLVYTVPKKEDKIPEKLTGKTADTPSQGVNFREKYATEHNNSDDLSRDQQGKTNERTITTAVSKNSDRQYILYTLRRIDKLILFPSLLILALW